MPEEKVGQVIKFFAKPSVAAIEVTDTIKVGDKLHFKGHTTDFEQVVESIQIDNKPVETASSGDKIGIKVAERVREKDEVFRVTE